MKRKFIQVVAFMLAFILFISCPLSVYASEKWEGSLGLTLYYNLEDVKQYIKETAGFWPYAFSQIGAIFKGNNWKQFMDNYEKMDELLDGNVGLYKENESSPVKGVFLSKEFMAELKAILEEYLKTEQAKEENGGFYLIPTTKYIDVPATSFSSSFKYQTFSNIVLEKGLLAVNIADVSFVDLFSDPAHPKQLYFVYPTLPDYYIKHLDSKVYTSFICAYDWVLEKTMHPIMKFEEENKVYKSCSEAVQASTANSGYIDSCVLNGYDKLNYCLFSTTGEIVRVFVSQNAAKNYSVGSRKVFVTQNFYDYEPADLTVSIDDLQKSVDDLQKIIDELLKRVTDNSSEKEIMELLRQILEELRNQQGTGGGGGSGDVTVSVDLKETNSWLSKIFDKVSQIYDRMNSAVEDAKDAAIAKIQESLEEIIEELKKIKRWTAVDTVIDGVDAVADWLDLIRGLITDAEEGVGTAVTTVAENLADSTDSLSTKFPFSIPWDILFFISVLAAEPQVPYFEIPMDIEMEWLDIYIHYDFVIDFTQYQWFSDLSRLILSMTYAVGLIRLTMNIALLKKEE